MKGDLTKGSPGKCVLKFSLPLMLSVVFQQLYSISDSIIVGQFAADGEAALASVGASYPITMIYLAVALGSNAGCSVVISQLFGSRRFKDLKTAASTSIIGAAVLSLVMSAVGIVFSDDILRLLNTPESIMKDSTVYLVLFNIGFLLLFLYNIGNGIFTALGDSVTPLVFLISSSIANVILNYILVRFFHLDVLGVALASVITQSIAGVLSFIFVIIRLSKIKSERFCLFSFKMLAIVARYAIPGILQQSFISVGNLFIQGIVNSFGAAVIAGYSAAVKLNTFCLSTIATLGNAISSYTAQNIGAGKLDRVKQGMRAGVLISTGVALLFFGAYFFFAEEMLSLFISSKDLSETALLAGSSFLMIISPFYVIGGVKLMCDGILRGAGAMIPFMIATFTDLLLRVVLAFALVHFVPSLEYNGVWISWPVGWCFAAVLSLIYYFTGAWKRGVLV